jgi:hypothetical protein
MRISLILRTLLLAGTLALAACSSAPERADKPPVETDDPLDMDAPSPEQLADSPCGNPDWSKLPPNMPEDPKSP